MTEISKISEVQLAQFKKIADADSNGKIEENEIPVFEEGIKNMTINGKLHDRFALETTINGAKINLYSIDKISADNNAQTTVTTKDGIKFTYDKQEHGAHVRNCGGYEDKDTGFMFTDFKDGKGLTITGSQYHDSFMIKNSKIASIDGKGGQYNHIELFHCTGNTDETTVYADYGMWDDCKNIKIKKDKENSNFGIVTGKATYNDNVIDTNKEKQGKFGM